MSQVTDSEGHPEWNRRKVNGSLQDIGGDFYTTKQYVISNQEVIAANSGWSGDSFPSTFRRKYDLNGVVYCVDPTSTSRFPASTASSGPAQLDTLGATAVSRSKPTDSIGDATTFLGELMKDGLPRLPIAGWQRFTDFARNSGDQYLNVEFGWKPFISDLSKFAYGVKHASSVMSQYERDAGKVVRRRYEFPLERQTSGPVLSGSSNPFPGIGISVLHSPFHLLRGDLIVRSETTKRKWFSGAFTYYLPSGYHSRSRMDRLAEEADKVFGLSLTPENVWNLAPWSWAGDWFSNTGDVLSNLSDWATDGLVMRYGYMMEHTINKSTYTRATELRPFANQVGSLASVTFVRETKIRRRANPFGFGMTWSGLTSRQSAIAVALGLTRR